MTATLGYWLTRAVAGGPLIPVAIEMRAVEHEPGNPDNDMRDTRSPVPVGSIAGRACHPEEVWKLLPMRFEGGRWVRGLGELSPSEFRFRVADAEWRATYAPGDPIATPDRATDWSRVKPPTFEKGTTNE
jgi:hypothetical protein